MSPHVGTHADAPSHVLEGATAIGSVALEAYVGRARVIDLPVRGEVGADALPPRSLRIRRILFRTRGRAFLSPLAALRLVERGAILVGTDALSIDPADAEVIARAAELGLKPILACSILAVGDRPSNYR